MQTLVTCKLAISHMLAVSAAAWHWQAADWAAGHGRRRKFASTGDNGPPPHRDDNPTELPFWCSSICSSLATFLMHCSTAEIQRFLFVLVLGTLVPADQIKCL